MRWREFVTLLGGVAAPPLAGRIGDGDARPSTGSSMRRESQLVAFAALLASIMVAQAIAQADSASRREIVDADTYPWSSVGKVGNSVGGQCTGVVISANEFLTAAHCIYYPATRRLLPADSIHFLLGYIRGEYRMHKIAAKYVLPPTYDAPVEGKARPDDWVLLSVSEPFPPDIKPLTMADAVSPAGMPVKAGG